MNTTRVLKERYNYQVKIQINLYLHIRIKSQKAAKTHQKVNRGISLLIEIDSDL